jgi:hypothetical protein
MASIFYMFRWVDGWMVGSLDDWWISFLSLVVLVSLLHSPSIVTTLLFLFLFSASGGLSIYQVLFPALAKQRHMNSQDTV